MSITNTRKVVLNGTRRLSLINKYTEEDMHIHLEIYLYIYIYMYNIYNIYNI